MPHSVSGPVGAAIRESSPGADRSRTARRPRRPTVEVVIGGDGPLSRLLGLSPLNGVTSEDIAETIHEYGPERVVPDSDVLGYRHGDERCIAGPLDDLHRLGIGVDALRQIAFETRRDLLGLVHVET